MKSIGIAGTAKNTGKTTTTAFLAQALRQTGYTIALTSIGYDGEAIDTISGLPKPRLMVEVGDLIATAADCLTASTAKLEILAETSCQTPLGKVLITRVQQEGLAVLVGPNKTSDLKQVNQALAKVGSKITLVDGALNRLAPLVVCDGLILATGASRSRNIEQLAHETSFIQRLLSLPSACSSKKSKLSLLDAHGELLKESAITSLLSPAGIHQFLGNHRLEETDQLYLPGILSLAALNALPPCNLILENPLYLLLENDVTRLSKALQPWLDNNRIHIQNSVKLLALTVNPVFHDYDSETGIYALNKVDAQDLLDQISNSCPATTTLNIINSGVKDLAKKILDF